MSFFHIIHVSTEDVKSIDHLMDDISARRVGHHIIYVEHNGSTNQVIYNAKFNRTVICLTCLTRTA